MAARRYGISFRIFNSISHEWAQFCLLYKHTNDNVFDHFCFPKISEDFPKLFQNERVQTFSEDYEHFPKIAEDYRRNVRRWFDHTPTNLSVVWDKSKILSKWYLHMWHLQYCRITKLAEPRKQFSIPKPAQNPDSARWWHEQMASSELFFRARGPCQRGEKYYISLQWIQRLGPLVAKRR